MSVAPQTKEKILYPKTKMTTVAEDDALKIIRIETAPWGTNAYGVICKATGKSLLVDAPSQAGKLIGSLEETSPQFVVITHNHMDHIGALAEINSRLAIPVAAHPNDGLPIPTDILLNDCDTLSVGTIDLKVIHTPGHTPGSICLLTGPYLISGDTVFPGGPGRTESPKALEQIVDSITRKIFILADETEVYPGHGDATILGKEKRIFEVFSAKSHLPGLCGDVLWLSS